MPVPQEAKIEVIHTRHRRRKRLGWGVSTIGVDCCKVRIDGVTHKQFCGRLRKLRTWIYIHFAERIEPKVDPPDPPPSEPKN